MIRPHWQRVKSDLKSARGSPGSRKWSNFKSFEKEDSDGRRGSWVSIENISSEGPASGDDELVASGWVSSESSPNDWILITWRRCNHRTWQHQPLCRFRPRDDKSTWRSRSLNTIMKHHYCEGDNSNIPPRCFNLARRSGIAAPWSLVTNELGEPEKGYKECNESQKYQPESVGVEGTVGTSSWIIGDGPGSPRTKIISGVANN